MRLLVPAATAALIAAAAVSAMAATPFAETPAAGAAPAASPTTAPLTTPPARPAARPAQQTTWLTSAGGPLGDATGVAPRSGFVWPLTPRPAILRRFEQPRSQWSSGHRGVDLSATVGQAVFSAGEGVVAFSGVIAGRGVVTVRHLGGLRTTYEPVDERLATATVVHRGARIGVISSTPGHCVPLTCLHWGAIGGPFYRDPLTLLGFGRPILLPLG
jgi:murein DD-endopeptidase MepM/ murein hydrolase activator NlpD